MNCLTMALWLWIHLRFQGHIGILKWGDYWPHFAVFIGPWAYHYRTKSQNEPLLGRLWYDGEWKRDWVGPPVDHEEEK